MTDTLADLERKFNGPIPQSALDALRHGSALNAEIFRTEDAIAFYRDLIIRTRRGAKAWFQRGNMEMVRGNMDDSWFYLREWRKLRRHLGDLRGTGAAVKGAGRVLDMIYPREPGDG